jgi:hypothetical protein
VYDIIDTHDIFDLKKMEDNSDSDKELMQWEMEKLKNGINANWAINRNRQIQQNLNKSNNINEMFKSVKLESTSINEIIKKVEDDINNSDVFKYIFNKQLAAS